MILELTLIDLLLFCWGIVATGYALKYREESLSTRMFARMLIENKEVRDDVVSKFENLKRGNI